MLLPSVAWWESITNRKMGPVYDLLHIGLILTSEALVERWAANRTADEAARRRRGVRRAISQTTPRQRETMTVLARHKGNVTTAAKELGVTRTRVIQVIKLMERRKGQKTS